MSTQQLIFAVLYFGLGIGLIFLAFLIIRDSARIRLNRVTSAMLFFAGLGPIFAALGSVISPYQAGSPFQESAVYNLFYIWELFFPTLLYFSWVFPHDRLAGRPGSRWRMLIFVPHIFHVLLLVGLTDTDRILDLLTIQPGSGGFLNALLEPVAGFLQWLMIPIELLLSSHKKFFAFINLAYVILAIIYLHRGIAHVTAARLRKQVHVIIWGIRIALGLYIITFILPRIVSLELSETLASLLTIMALVIGAGTIAWAIIRYQFLDIRLIVRQSLVYTVSSALLVGAYLLVITKLSGFLESIFGQQLPLVNILFVIVALILFQPINSQIDNIIKWTFIRDRSDTRNIVNRISSQIVNLLDRNKLLALVRETLRSELLIENVSYALYNEGQRAYVYFSDTSIGETRLSNTDPLLGAIGQLKQPAFYDRIEAWRRGSALATLLETDRVQLVVPINDGQHLLGFFALGEKTSGYKYSAEDTNLLSTLANQMAVGFTNIRFYHESLLKQRLEEEMKLARKIQLDLLPDYPPRGDSFVISTHSQPSRTVGGDFFDFIAKPDDSGFGLIIADVSGKGMPAALLVAQIQAAMRMEIINRRSVADVLNNVNLIVTNLSSSSGKFATLFYGEFNPHTGLLEYCNAGHNYPILVRSDGSCETLVAGGPIIGAFEENRYDSAVTTLRPDDLVFFYTDGLSEAQNRDEEEFGEERIMEYLCNNCTRDVEEIKTGILEEVRNFSAVENPDDDTTIVILKMKTQPI